MSASRHLTDERGSASLELVVWGPVLLLLVTVVIFAGRTAQAGMTVDAAAGEAARAATVADDRAQAVSRAREAAQASLESAGLKCSTVDVALDTSQWARPPGQAATASATVSCRIELDDLVGVSVPGTKTVSSTATSALDTYRQRR